MACFELGPNLSLVDSTRDELRFQRFDLQGIISLGRLPQAEDEFASSTLNTYAVYDRRSRRGTRFRASRTHRRETRFCTSLRA
jgi:hypothetical protein